MTLVEARQHLAQVGANPNAQFIHQDFVDESRRLSDARDDAAQGRLEDALARVMLEGDEIEMMGAADALMAIPVRPAVLKSIASALPSLTLQRRDAAMRVLGVHRTSLPKDVMDDLDALFMAHPREFLRLALVVLPDAVKPTSWRYNIRSAYWPNVNTLGDVALECLKRARNQAATPPVVDLSALP